LVTPSIPTHKYDNFIICTRKTLRFICPLFATFKHIRTANIWHHTFWTSTPDGSYWCRSQQCVLMSGKIYIANKIW
jgi:hypothetical protein